MKQVSSIISPYSKICHVFYQGTYKSFSAGCFSANKLAIGPENKKDVFPLVRKAQMTTHFFHKLFNKTIFLLT